LPSLLNPFSLFMGNSSSKAVKANSVQEEDDAKHGHSNSRSNLKNNTQIQYLSAHTGIVRCVCKLDEDRFASSSDDGLILIWNTHNGLLLDVGCGHTAPILSLLVIDYKSQALLISASLDHSVRVWRIARDPAKAMQCISVSREHNAPLIRMVYYEQTKKVRQNGLITASNTGSIGVWCVNDQFDFTQCDQANHSESQDFFRLLRLIDLRDKCTGKNEKRARTPSYSSSESQSMSSCLPQITITQMLFLNTESVQQLIVGCKNGTIIFVNFDKNDRIKLIHKHSAEIKYVYQSSVDRFITASYDGLICVWRIEVHFPQILERINDVQQNISSWAKSPNVDAMYSINSTPKESASRKKKEKHSSKEAQSKSACKPEIITEAKDLRLNCFIDFVDEYDDKYFIVSFSHSFVIFDCKFLVKCMVKNVYGDNSEITAMCMFRNDGKFVLVTANNKHIIKLWNLGKINLHAIETGLWLSCFRQELLYNVDENHRRSSKKNKKNMVSDLCVDCEQLLVNKFSFHSGAITAMQMLNEHTFVSADKMHQIILWKDAYYVSYLHNKTIKQFYNLPCT